jgi:UPF0716 protein FxsA
VILPLVFIVVPFVELVILLRVGQEIGVANTIALLVAVSVVGAWLVKREGIAVLRRAQATMNAGRVPAAELLDGVLILFAGALLITPGFLSDCFGVLLLIPPVRAAVRAGLRKYLARRVQIYR